MFQMYTVNMYVENLHRICCKSWHFWSYLLLQHSEPIGVIVLERCAVELDPDEELLYSFVLGKKICAFSCV